MTRSWARIGYSPGGAQAGMGTTTSASRCSPLHSVNGSSPGVADQPSGHTTVTVPSSAESLQSLAAVRRNTTSLPGSAVTR